MHSTNSFFSSENYTRLLIEALAARQRRICHHRMAVIDASISDKPEPIFPFVGFGLLFVATILALKPPAIDIGSCGNGPVWYSIQNSEPEGGIMEMGRQLSRCGWRSQLKGCNPRKSLLYVHTIPFLYHPSQNEMYTWPINEICVAIIPSLVDELKPCRSVIRVGLQGMIGTIL